MENGGAGARRQVYLCHSALYSSGNGSGLRVGGEGVGAPIYSAPAPLSLAMHTRAEKAPCEGEEGSIAPCALSSQELSHGGQEALASSCVVVGSTAGRVVCLQFPCWPSWAPHLEHQEVPAGQMPSQAPEPLPAGRTARAVWSRNVGSPVFAPASVCPAESTVLIPCAGARLLSLHAQTGEEVWSFATHGPLMSAALVTPPGIIVGCHKGWVYCVDAKDGRACWQRELVPHLHAPVAGVYV